MKTKTCTKCKKEKSIKGFSRNRNTKDGYNFVCKECMHKYNEIRKNGIKKIPLEKKCNSCGETKPSNLFYIDNNKPDGLSTFCKECKDRSNRRWAKNNPEKNEKSNVKSREKRKGAKREYDKKYRERNRNNSYRNLVTSLSSCVRSLIIKEYKGSNYEKYLGCTPQEAKKHLESLFLDGMSWENYGDHRNNGWEIDHIIPISSFDLTKEENIYKCFNYKNIQPLWWYQNQKKYKKVLNEKELRNLRNEVKVTSKK